MKSKGMEQPYQPATPPNKREGPGGIHKVLLIYGAGRLTMLIPFESGINQRVMSHVAGWLAGWLASWLALGPTQPRSTF